MSSIKDIIEIEQNRQHPNEIHLFAEGTFWRAYERSAWLCVRCVNERLWKFMKYGYFDKELTKFIPCFFS